MITLLSTFTMIILSLTGGQCNEACSFNRLCTCRSSHHEVICRGVPFSKFPSLPTEAIYQVKIMRSGLEILNNNIFEGSSVASLHLMQNNIICISPWAFSGLEDILTTLDLSQNKISQFPLNALSPLNNLQWLNLHGNQIDDIQNFKWSQLNCRSSLNSLFLGANSITSIPEGAFVKLINLNLLDLDGNLIHDVESNSMPFFLKSLSISNNILKKVPLHAIYSLKHLKFLYLAGNLIQKLPCPFYLHVSRLEKLELSNNMMTHFPECVFNGSFTIKELHLDFNFIRILSGRSFKGTKLERLVLANNRITNIHADAFVGIEKTLTILDLSFNLLEMFPTAVNDLKSLMYLSLKSNLLKQLDKGDLHGCRSKLETLDLSGNIFQHVPKKALKSLTKLVRLSLQDNKIQKIHRDDFEGWGQTLTTLSLANNKMTYLSGGSFSHLSKLKELKLSFNNLMHVDQQVFIPLRKTLEVLDLTSAFTEYNYPLENFIRDLDNLEWLQVDHNNISKLSAFCTDRLQKFRHLDISNNDLKDISVDVFKMATHAYLSAVHVSHNELEVIRSGTFDALPHLSTAVLYSNKISLIEGNSFSNCPYLHTVVLSDNEISAIHTSAFNNLTKLSNVYLQNNKLECFSFDIFSGDTSPLYLNLSNNLLRELNCANDSLLSLMKTRTLDLTNNMLTVIPDSLFFNLEKYLMYLFISKNNISNLPSVPLPNLQILQLSCNAFEHLNATHINCCRHVQILTLDHNNLFYVERDSFKNMKNLRILDLSFNNLDFLPDGTFSDTGLEHLNVSHNRLIELPIISLTDIRTTLKHLDLSLNLFKNISADSFLNLNHLQALNLSSNFISFLHEQSLNGLNSLIELDLSHNPLRKLSETSLSSLNSLRSLYLQNTSLISLSVLPFPNLHYLNLRDNYLYNISQDIFEKCRNVRFLDISRNLLQNVPMHLWRNLRKLVGLDISGNPIEVLGINSFSELDKLNHLDISGLSLKILDSRTFFELKFLTSIKTDSYASVRSFRLQELLSQASALKKVVINIEESILSHQVQRAFGTKIRELVINGQNLKKILPDAFAGLLTHELTIRISGTMVNQFPDGLLRYLPDVRYLTLDLRNNQLASMGPKVLAAMTRDGPDAYQTQHITGGVLLEENPWNCSCELLWLGRWMRRWLIETFHVHMLSVEAALYVNTVSKKTTCTIPGTNSTLSIVDLRVKDVNCEVVSNSASCPSCIMFLILFCYALLEFAQGSMKHKFTAVSI
ncbi:chaoptin [Parasteatoda tepidariorum]|uniref:chaoptin n=1 Tax=Parasteatoda tepidariorum TaxID=114398 RepID=UPI00077FD6E0|nr:chaoptin [Parasteatoda tepidariorum]